LKVEMPTLAEAAPGAAELLNPETMHTIAPVSVTAAEKFNSKEPDGIIKTEDALEPEQDAEAAFAL
jgi:hypothetical protein